MFRLRLQVLINIKSYPTQTDLVVITNKPDHVARWRDNGTTVVGLDFEVWRSLLLSNFGMRKPALTSAERVEHIGQSDASPECSGACPSAHVRLR